MEKVEHIRERALSINPTEVAHASIDTKLDELIALLETHDLTKESLDRIQTKFNSAFKKAEVTEKDLADFRTLDNPQATRENRLDDLEKLLLIHQLDSRVSKKILFRDKLKRFTLLIISLVLITLGFAMIIMPAPPYFEMFTVFYFNRNDGVTLMDLISLLVVFSGVYLFITALGKFNRSE